MLNFCRDALIAADEIGLSDVAFRDLGLPEGARVHATIAPAPRSVDLVRDKLRGGRLDRAAFDAILADVVAPSLLAGRALDVRAGVRAAHARRGRDRRLHARDDRTRHAASISAPGRSPTSTASAACRATAPP